MAFVGEWSAEAPVCHRQWAELRARAVLFAASSFSGHEEAEPASSKTLGVLGTGVGSACLAPCDGSKYLLATSHALACPCPPCLCWCQPSRDGNCQCRAALSRNHLKLKLCQKNFHLSAGQNNGGWPAGHSSGVATALTHCHLAAWGPQQDSPEVEVKPAFLWGTSPECSKTSSLKHVTFSL